MKNIRIFIFILLLFYFGIFKVSAKDTLFSINKYKEENFNFIKESYNKSGSNDGLIVAGEFLKAKENNQIIIEKFNFDGQKIWEFKYKNSKQNYLNYLTYTYNLDNQIDGYLISILEKDSSNTETSQGKILKIDLKGKLISEKTLDFADAILFRSHNKNVLIDTGGVSSYSSSNNDGKIFFNIIYPTFKSLGIKKLDYLILTHGDKDHLGEAKTLIENFKVKNIIINNNHINFYEQKLIEKNTIIGKQNLTFSLKDLSFIQLNENLDDENDSSQIYLVQYKNIKILLTGDASIKSEENLLNNYNLSNIDILKIGHHGSRSSTSDNFLKEIHPKIALISAGRNNKFNHPHQEVLERLNKYHVKTYCTKELGTLTINLDKMEIKSDL